MKNIIFHGLLSKIIGCSAHSISSAVIVNYRLLPPIKLRINEVEGISLSDTGVK